MKELYGQALDFWHEAHSECFSYRLCMSLSAGPQRMSPVERVVSLVSTAVDGLTVYARLAPDSRDDDVKAYL
jgi:hypothetical protein